MRGALAVVSFAATLLLAACGGGEAADSGEMRLTLTDDGCTYEGTKTPEAPMFTIAVENQTGYFGAFALGSIAGNSTIDDLEPYLDEAQEQFQRNGTLPDWPPFYEQMVRSGVDAGSSSSLPASVPAGRYALVCFVDDLPTWKVYAAGQLDVTG
jgi:hypothetical protein